MSMHVFDIFQKPSFDDSIRRIEERTYYPYVKSFGNNDIIEITVNQSDSWFLMSESSISIRGKLEKTAGEGNVELAMNAPAFFFDSITYEQCGREIETVRDPGRLSTIKGYLLYEPAHSKDLYIAGWNYPQRPAVTATDNSFHFIVPLKHLFGIFNSYNRVTCGKQTIRLVRARSDNDCLIITQKPQSETTAKITIDNIELKLIHVFPNDEIKLDLLQAVKRDAPIIIPFMRWEIHELPALKTGATREIWSVKTSSALESPRFVIVAFQTDRTVNSAKDPTLFDHINITNIRLSLNSDYWPNERMMLDFSKNDFMQAYKNYADFSYSYCGEKRPLLLDYVAFHSHCLFVIDCSRREDSMKSSTVDIKLDIETKDGFPNRTKALCVIVHDCLMEYLPLSEIVRSLT